MTNERESLAVAEGMPRRSFTLRDLLILIAAFALGAALTKWMIPFGNNNGVVGGFLTGRPWPATSLAIVEGVMSDLICLGPSWLFAGSVGLVLLRLLPPRPRLGDLITQPGAAASLAVVAMAVIALVLSTLAMVMVQCIIRRSQNELSYVTMVFNNGRLLGSPIGLIWLTLVLTDRWRPQRDWLDRLGRVLGVAWIVVFLLAWWWELVGT
jgi:hypothetical protein